MGSHRLLASNRGRAFSPSTIVLRSTDNAAVPASMAMLYKNSRVFRSMFGFVANVEGEDYAEVDVSEDHRVVSFFVGSIEQCPAKAMARADATTSFLADVIAAGDKYDAIVVRSTAKLFAEANWPVLSEEPLELLRLMVQLGDTSLIWKAAHETLRLDITQSNSVTFLSSHFSQSHARAVTQFHRTRRTTLSGIGSDARFIALIRMIKQMWKEVAERKTGTRGLESN